MKLIIILSLLLMSCVAVPKFDPNQYGAVVDINIITDKTYLCKSKPQQQLLVHMLHEKVTWVQRYSLQLPKNTHANIMFNILNKEVTEFSEVVNTGASETYCIEQLTFIREQSTIIQRALGTTQR